MTFESFGQNQHPMHFAMISVFVEDPVKAFQHYTEILGFEEVMFQPENQLAIVRSSTTSDGPMLLLEPMGIEIAKTYKSELYKMGIPVMSFGAADIYKTTAELKEKGVKFTKDPVETDWGHEAVFDDNNGNYIQLIQMN